MRDNRLLIYPSSMGIHTLVQYFTEVSKKKKSPNLTLQAHLFHKLVDGVKLVFFICALAAQAALRAQVIRTCAI